MKVKNEKKLRVVIFVTYTFPYIGSGIGHVALKQAEGLAKLGHEVVLVSSNIPHTKREFRKNGVLHLKLKATDFLEKYHLPVPLFLINAKVISHLKKADIIHGHGMFYPSSLQGALLAKRYGKPFILTQHIGYINYPSPLINLFQRLVNKTMGKIILKLSQKVIVINEEVRNWLDIDPQRVITLINGVEVSLFHPVGPRKKKALRKEYNLPLNKKIVLYIGRLVPKKGFDKVYEARSHNYLAILVGNGLIPQYMKKDGDVLFFGGQPQEKLAEIYQLSDLFVLPSRSEGFPLVIQEAMASGLPIITTKHPGYDKYLDKRYIKYIIPTKKAIKKAISGLLADRTLMEKMSQYSRDMAVKITWEENIEGLLDIYREAL